MAAGSNGYRASLMRRQLTPGLISSLPGRAGLPPFISFSTSYPDLELPCAVLCVALAMAGSVVDAGFVIGRPTTSNRYAG